MALHSTGVGRIMKAAQIRDVSGTPVANFRLGFRNGKEKDGTYKDSTFVNAALWGPRATALTQYLDEGKSVLVTGSITTREYEHNGEKRTSLEMRIAELEFVGGKEERQSQGNGNGSRSKGGGFGNDAGGSGYDDDDKMPF